MEAAAAFLDDLDLESARLGTRFLVYPQPPFVLGYERPEVVWLPIPPREIGPGPSSARAYVLYPLGDKDPYQAPRLPPYRGPCHPLAAAGPDGHFDHLVPGSPEFLAAHAFACVHRILAVCESYARVRLPWFFESELERLEIIPHVRWNNAQAGFGFIEMGEDTTGPEPFPYALNFDAVAHEMGHLVLLGAMGPPPSRGATVDYLTYHETVADFVSMLGLLHFDTALERILRRTRGNLLIMNELDRFAEQSDEKQIRRFANSLRMEDVGAEVHDRSKPLAGALFDTMIEIYQAILFERGLTGLDPREFRDLRRELPDAVLEHELSAAPDDYELRHYALKSALSEARDIVGTALVQSWGHLDPADFSLADATEALILAVERGRSRSYVDRFIENLQWRQLF